MISELFTESQRSNNAPRWLHEKKFAEIVRVGVQQTVLTIEEIDDTVVFLAKGPYLGSIDEDKRQMLFNLHIGSVGLTHLLFPYYDAESDSLWLQYASIIIADSDFNSGVYLRIREDLINYLETLLQKIDLIPINYKLEEH